VLQQLALLPERPRPTRVVEAEERELARRRRAAAGTGARTNADDMVIGAVAVAGVIAIVVEDYKR
jgi:predicted nucleic acid-binding protein